MVSFAKVVAFSQIYSLLFFTAITAEKDLDPPAKHRGLNLDCPNAVGFYVVAEIDVQTYLPSYCGPRKTQQQSDFLLEKFVGYSVYDEVYGPLIVDPERICAPLQQRRHLEFEPANNHSVSATTSGDYSSSIHRGLRRSGFILKLSAICRLCSGDNSDSRRDLLSSPCTIPTTIRIKTDAYPDEFSYQVLDSTGLVVHQSSTFEDAHTEYTEILYLPPDSSYELVLNDLYGDGICCDNGQGYVKVYVEDATSTNDIMLVDSCGVFEAQQSIWFQTPPEEAAELCTSTDPVSPASVLLPTLEVKYSTYLSYYLQKRYHYTPDNCLYGKYPSVTVKFTEVTMSEARELCC